MYLGTILNKKILENKYHRFVSLTFEGTLSHSIKKIYWKDEDVGIFMLIDIKHWDEHVEEEGAVRVACLDPELLRGNIKLIGYGTVPYIGYRYLGILPTGTSLHSSSLV